jgi:CheY-like chemotaxis protein
MVEAHGGTLTLHETMGGGATFRATFPLLDGVTRDQEANDQESRPSSGHVLIVDDEPEIAAILADCLAPMGVTCAIASDGVTALSLISNTHFDAVFCDVRMPGMDGIAFFARMKAEHPELATRLAFVSGDVLHRDLARLRAASDRPIIEKPFDPQLVRDIAMLLLAPHGEAQ